MTAEEEEGLYLEQRQSDRPAQGRSVNGKAQVES